MLLDKASYVNQRGLGGLHSWELSLDDEQATPAHTIARGLDAPSG